MCNLNAVVLYQWGGVVKKQKQRGLYWNFTGTIGGNWSDLYPLWYSITCVHIYVYMNSVVVVLCLPRCLG